VILVKKGKTARIATALSISTMLLLSNTAMAAGQLYKIGDRGAEVQKIQEALKNLGYFNHEVTGYYGSVTKNAVIKFQASKGLSQDGIVGEKTMQLLLASSTKKESSRGDSDRDFPILKEGDSGEAVRRLQEALVANGYYTYPVDGVFGPGTRLAVEKFQKELGLLVDGVVGDVTWDHLLGSIDREEEAVSEGGSGLLKVGAEGQAVKDLQQKLKDRGFYQGKVDGIFGSGTKEALMEFQKAVGLSPDGVAGPATLAELCKDFEFIKEGSTGKCVEYLQQKLKELGYYTGKVDGVFGQGTVKALKSFQKAAGIAADGVAGPSTIAKLTAGSTSRGTTESRKVQRLSWSVVNSMWSRDFGEAIVIDYQTGKQFKVIRTGGYNHADVETATAKDTAILKQIYGGSFSWTRRPVIVVINGQRIAASMAGMPHAGRDDKPFRVNVSGRSGGYGYGVNYDGVKGNNMDGHFDIHFLGSKTHGTNRVDSQHQAALKSIPLG